MSTSSVETNQLATVPEIQMPDEGSQKRSMALVRTKQFLDTVAVIKDGRVELKIAVSTPEAYQRAGNLLLTVKSYRKDLDSVFRPEIDRRYRLHREATAEFNVGDKPAEAVEKALSAAICTFQREAERIRLVEQSRLQELARKQAEEEQRARMVESTLNAAVEAEQAGNKELAEQIIAAPIDATPAWVPPVILQSALPKIEGMSSRTAWKARVKGEEGTPEYHANFMLLVKAVAAGTAPASLLEVNDSALNNMAKVMKSQFAIPGCEAYPATGLAGRV